MADTTPFSFGRRFGLMAVPLAKGFATIVVSTVVLIVLCAIFAPSAVTAGSPGSPASSTRARGW